MRGVSLHVQFRKNAIERRAAAADYGVGEPLGASLLVVRLMCCGRS